MAPLRKVFLLILLSISLLLSLAPELSEAQCCLDGAALPLLALGAVVELVGNGHHHGHLRKIIKHLAHSHDHHHGHHHK